MIWVAILFRGLFILALILEICGPLAAHAAQPGGGSWIERWREATVAIGATKRAKISDSAGKEVEKEIFTVVGTGVVFGLPGQAKGLPWLVTAKHVLYDPGRKWAPESVQLRFAWSDDKPVEEYLGVTLRIRDKGQPLWIEDESGDFDLAAIPLQIPVKDVGRETIRAIVIENFATAEDVFEGARVLVFGYPGAIGREFWTRPLLRSGAIAWVNPRDPLGESLLVDASIFPGNSGGPVFRDPSGINRSGSFQLGGRVSFLGIISQGRRQPMPLTAGKKEIDLQGPTGVEKIVSESWMAIGLVEPASRVRRLLDEAAKKKK